MGLFGFVLFNEEEASEQLRITGPLPNTLCICAWSCRSIKHYYIRTFKTGIKQSHRIVHGMDKKRKNLGFSFMYIWLCNSFSSFLASKYPRLWSGRKLHTSSLNGCYSGFECKDNWLLYLWALTSKHSCTFSLIRLFQDKLLLLSPIVCWCVILFGFGLRVYASVCTWGWG